MSIEKTFKNVIDGQRIELNSLQRENNKLLEQGLNATNKRNSEIGDKLGNAQIQNIQLINQLNLQQIELKKEKEKKKKLEQEVEAYKQLLCKPMMEIAEKSGDFQKTYEQQMQVMADWMVSQKAFKELAIEFGFEKGLSPEEVIGKGREKMLDVLENNNDPEHGTNAKETLHK